MRPEELREHTMEELDQKLKDTRNELFNLRFQQATGQLKNYKRIKEVKKNIARILTVIKEKQRISAKAE